MSVIVVVCMYALPIVVVGYFLYMEVEKIRYGVRKQIKDMHFKESLHSLGSLQGVHSTQGTQSAGDFNGLQDTEDSHTHSTAKHRIAKKSA